MKDPNEFQGHAGLEPVSPHTEAVISAVMYFLCGIGFLAALIAGLCFFGGWE